MNSIPNRTAPAMTRYRPSTTASGTPRRRHRKSNHAAIGEGDRFWQLCWMYGNVRRRQPVWKRDTPRKIRRSPIVVADKETPDAPDSVTDCERRRRGGQPANERHLVPVEQPQACADSADEAAEPTQTPAAEQQFANWLLTAELNRPEKLRANQTSDYATNRGVRHQRATRSASTRG